MKSTLSASTVTAAVLVAAGTMANAQELRFLCHADGNDCDTTLEIIQEFEAQNPGVSVTMDVVPYDTILKSLPVQLAAGSGPDFAKVNPPNDLNPFYLDLTPYVDVDYWETNFGSTLPWFRAGPEDNGIYGMMQQLTITGAYINKTLFDQAGIEPPAHGASWEDWRAAARDVAEATGVPFPMALDRSGHRFAGPAISVGAKIFDDSGKPILVDEAFTSFAQNFVDWHNDGTFARDVWVGSGGSSYQDGSAEFLNSNLVYYFSGSWQVQRFSENIGDAFDWVVVGSPCGDGGCTGMPGGPGIVGFNRTEHPELVASLIDYLAQEEKYRQFTAKTLSVPAHAKVAADGVDYAGATPEAAAALNGWGAEVERLSPVALQYQGYPNARALFNITLQRVSQAIVGELTVAEAMDRAKADLDEALAATEN